MSLAAVHGHYYILVNSKSLSMMKSCICMSIMYTLYIQVYSICGDFPNNILNCLVPLVTYFVIPLLMASDLQTDDVALKSKNAWLVLFVAPCHVYPWTCTFTKIILRLHHVAVYWYKHEIMPSCEQHVALPHHFILFCHSRWWLLDARDCWWHAVPGF